MRRLFVGAIVGLALGAAATASAIATRVIELRSGDVAPVKGTHVFCKVGPQAAGTGIVCSEVKKGIEASYAVGITDESVFVLHYKGSHGEGQTVIFSRRQHY